MKYNPITFAIVLLILSKTLTTNAQSCIFDSIPISGADTLFNGKAIDSFLLKLHNSNQSKNNVRILHLGDSHMQMGYFVEEMRNNFDKNWGLSSYGTIFPYSIAKYRPFYINSKVLKGNWECNNYLNRETDLKYGMSGFTAKTNDKYAEIEIMPVRCDSDICLFDEVTIYFSSPIQDKITITGINTFQDSTCTIQADSNFSFSNDKNQFGWRKATFHFQQQVNKLFISVLHNVSAPFYLYSINLENEKKKGIIYNNCGVGGAQFSHLMNNASLAVSQITDLKPDLIILSYGTNESYTSLFNPLIYDSLVNNFIDKLKSSLPSSSIILTSPPDTRAKNRYPKNLDSIEVIFNDVAIAKNIAYWNLRKQMGGDGSLYTWFKKNLVAKDKLHFTKLGYQIQAKLFMQAILNEYNKITLEDKLKVKPITLPVRLR